MRTIELTRKTTEVTIQLKIDIDGSGNYNINTGIKFFDHLLGALSKHAMINLDVVASGDLQHHIIEDVAIILGEALNKLLLNGSVIERFGAALVPMDDALARVAIDICNRPFANLNLEINDTKQIEGMNSEDFEHFLLTLANTWRINLHATILSGNNYHHKMEAIMKALARAMKIAVRLKSRDETIPSTKGVM